MEPSQTVIQNETQFHMGEVDMSQPVDRNAVGRRAHEMMTLLNQEMNGDPVEGARSSKDFQRRLDYLKACGVEVGTPWPEVAKAMRATYLKNQQQFDSGRGFNPWIPAVQFGDHTVITARPNYMPGRNLGQLLFQPLTDGNIHKVGATAYRKDECVNLEGQPSGGDRFSRFPQKQQQQQPRVNFLAPRG
jgi:hypothetical protein